MYYYTTQSPQLLMRTIRKEEFASTPNQRPAFIAEQQRPLAADAYSITLRAALQSEQARLLYAGIPVSLAVNALIALILVATQRGMLNTESIIAWSTLLGATLVLRAVFALAYYRAQADALASNIWLTRFRVALQPLALHGD